MPEEVLEHSVLHIDGRQVIPHTDGQTGFWDAEDHLFSVPHRVDEQSARVYLRIYDKGREHGEVYGRLKVQYEMRQILGVKP